MWVFLCKNGFRAAFLNLSIPNESKSNPRNTDPPNPCRMHERARGFCSEHAVTTQSRGQMNTFESEPQSQDHIRAFTFARQIAQHLHACAQFARKSLQDTMHGRAIIKVMPRVQRNAGERRTSQHHTLGCFKLHASRVIIDHRPAP